MNTDAISARFSGADMTFRIHREDLTYFKARLGPALAPMRLLAS
jgi:hypothetical protein